MAKPNFNFLGFKKQTAVNYNVSLKKLNSLIINAENSKRELVKAITLNNKMHTVTKTGIGPILTKYGRFFQMTFRVKNDKGIYFVIVKANIDRKTMLPVFNKKEKIFLRIDSGCSTGQLFHDINCDCREQLDIALEKLSMKKQGLIIHIFNQDGRGKGIEFKLSTLYLQEQLGINTIEAFTLLEKNNDIRNLDCRSYDGAVLIMKFLDIKSTIIMGTNNPLKLKPLQKNGFKIETEPILAKITNHTAKHLIAKKIVLGHMLG